MRSSGMDLYDTWAVIDRVVTVQLNMLALLRLPSI